MVTYFSFQSPKTWNCCEHRRQLLTAFKAVYSCQSGGKLVTAVKVVNSLKQLLGMCHSSVKEPFSPGREAEGARARQRRDSPSEWDGSGYQNVFRKKLHLHFPKVMWGHRPQGIFPKIHPFW